MPSKRVTMRDVALAAGVHQTTVSLALRHHPRLPAETRERIQRVAEEIGYRPDPMLSNLSNYRRNVSARATPPVIGYIMDLRGPGDPRFSHAHEAFLESAKRRAEALGYDLEVFYCGPDAYSSKDLERTLRSRGISGLILGAFWDRLTDLSLAWQFYSVIKIEMLPLQLSFDVVGNNQMQVTRLAMEKVHAMGFRRVGMAVASHDEDHARNLFTAGYFVGQQAFAEEDRVAPLIFEGGKVPFDRAEMAAWIQCNRIEAVISNWNYLEESLAASVPNWAPEVRFFSLDVDPDEPGMIGVKQNHDAVGRCAVEQVTSLMSTRHRGFVACPTMHLIDGFWQGEGVGENEAARTAVTADLAV